MSGSPQWGLQQAIYTRLNSDATLTSTLGCAVYDDPPDSAAFPYLTIGDVTESPNNTMGTTGHDATIVIHIWSQYEGFKEAKQIHNRVHELLHWWEPTVTDWTSHVLQGEFFETYRDPDGITRHAVSRYRIHLHE